MNEKLHEKANEVNEEQENSRENASKPIKRSHDEVNTEAVVYNNKWTRWSEPEALEEKEPETQISVSKWSKFKEQD